MNPRKFELWKQIQQLPEECLTRGILRAENDIQSRQLSETELNEIDELIQRVKGDSNE